MPLVTKAMGKFYPIGTLLSKFVPEEFLMSQPSYVALAYKEISEETKKMDHMSLIDDYIGMSNITSDLSVSYMEGCISMQRGETLVPGKEEELIATDSQHFQVAHTIVVGTVEGKKIEPALHDVARKIDFCFEQKDTLIMPRVLTNWTAPIEGVKLGTINMQWGERLTEVVGFKLPEGSAIDRSYKMLSSPNFKKTVQHIHLAADNKINVKVPSFKNLAQGDYVIQKLQATKDMIKYLKFYDIPRQFLNAPMKWGAVMGYLYGDPFTPKEAPSDSFYYGAAGGRAAKIFKGTTAVDLKPCVQLEKFSSKMDPELKKKLELERPRWVTGDIFNFDRSKFPGSWLFSDVFSSQFSDKQYEHLLSLVDSRSVVKFSMSLDKLYNHIVKVGMTSVVVLKFGRPLFGEVFLTKFKPKNFNFSDEDFADKYIWNCKTQKEIYECFFQIQKNIVVLNENHKSQHINGCKWPIKPVYRPFPVENWMMPQIISSTKSRVSSSAQMISIRDLGVKFDLDELVQAEDAIFMETMREAAGQSPSPNPQPIVINTIIPVKQNKGFSVVEQDVYDDSLFADMGDDTAVNNAQEMHGYDSGPGN